MTALPCNIHFLGEVDTTMDVAREYIAKAAKKEPFGVVGEVQLKGRGTGGRTWASPKGNLYFTLCIPQEDAQYCNQSLVPVLSLICGLACRAAILERLPGVHASSVTTKWPNDILYEKKKIGGTLVESESGYFLIGMGMNVDLAPPVTDGGREATSINAVAKAHNVPHTTPRELAEAIWRHFFAITTDPKATREQIVQDFAKTMDMTLKLHRRLPTGRDPTELTPVALNSWGHLTVRHPDGKEETLCAEYLF